DEINRATPKTQSALLEAMEEQQVTQDGVSRPLPRPFVVIATQNPQRQIGTFALPESQLDRFLMRLQVGYPSPAAERELLRGEQRRSLLENLEPVMSAEQLVAAQRLAGEVYVSDPLLDYLQAIIAQTRNRRDWETGLSPRAGLSLLRASQAYALLAGHDHVEPEHVQAVLPAVVAHRLHPSSHPADASELRSRAAAADARGEAAGSDSSVPAAGPGEQLIHRVAIP
ncbi:MAG: MoxR family ATPase, partial [Gammaproteobacteria bacterium]|nr:MoxR family ATPase [Gammaproteobacteria bacterium]